MWTDEEIVSIAEDAMSRYLARTEGAVIPDTDAFSGSIQHAIQHARDQRLVGMPRYSMGVSVEGACATRSPGGRWVLYDNVCSESIPAQ